MMYQNVCKKILATIIFIIIAVNLSIGAFAINLSSYGNSDLYLSIVNDVRNKIEYINITLHENMSNFIFNNKVKGSVFAPGAPIVPMISKNIRLPTNAILKSIKLKYKIIKMYNLNAPLKFDYAPPVTYDGLHFYTNKNSLPSVPIKMISTGAYRNVYKYVKIAYYPLIYNNTYLFCSEVLLTIIYYKNVLLNIEQSQSAAIGYVIVTTNNLLNNAKNISLYKKFLINNGYNVYIITENDYGYEKGQQRAINIRNWLKNNYISKNIRYVLLIGNPDPDDPSDPSDSYGDVPMMMVWPRAPEYEKCPTDYFYADLTGNWDLDGDGYYGEWGDDTGPGGVDYTADVYVGRIPVYDNDYSTLNDILGKLMHRGDLPSKILMPMAISNYPNENYPNQPKTDGQKLPYYVGQFASDYTKIAMYEGAGVDPVDSSAAYYTYNINENNFIQEWNKAYGYVLWNAHGWHDSAWREVWAFDDGDDIPESNEIKWYYFIDTNHTLSYLNQENTIVFQVSCLNGYPEDKYNLGYNLLKKSLATISASRVSWYMVGTWYPTSNPDDVNIAYSTLKEMITNDTSIGEALYKAKEILSSNLAWGNKSFMNLMDYNLYGAPEIRKTAPLEFPAAPQNLQAKAGDGYVILTWKAPTDDGGSPITEYKIYRGTSPSDETLLTVVDSFTTTYNDTSVTNGQTYYYYVTAVNDVGESWHSNEVAAKPYAKTNIMFIPFWFWLIIGLIIIIIIVGIILSVFRRRQNYAYIQLQQYSSYAQTQQPPRKQPYHLQSPKDYQQVLSQQPQAITVTCPYCGTIYTIPMNMRGLWLKCPHCGNIFYVQ